MGALGIPTDMTNWRILGNRLLTALSSDWSSDQRCLRCMRVSLKSCALNWFSLSPLLLPPSLPPFLSCCTSLQLIFMPCTCASLCMSVRACACVIYCLHLLFHMWKLQLQLPELQSKSKSRSFDAPNEGHSMMNTCRQHLGTNCKTEREKEREDPLHTAANPCHNTVEHMTHVSICLIAFKHTHVNVYFDFHFLTRQTNLDSCTWHMICICIGNGNGSSITPTISTICTICLWESDDIAVWRIHSTVFRDDIVPAYRMHSGIYNVSVTLQLVRVHSWITLPLFTPFLSVSAFQKFFFFIYFRIESQNNLVCWTI